MQYAELKTLLDERSNNTTFEILTDDGQSTQPKPSLLTLINQGDLPGGVRQATLNDGTNSDLQVPVTVEVSVSATIFMFRVQAVGTSALFKVPLKQVSLFVVQNLRLEYKTFIERFPASPNPTNYSPALNVREAQAHVKLFSQITSSLHSNDLTLDRVSSWVAANAPVYLLNDPYLLLYTVTRIVKDPALTADSNAFAATQNKLAGYLNIRYETLNMAHRMDVKTVDV